MGIINSVFNWIIKKRIHQIELFQKYPHEVQRELLQAIVQKAKNTVFGKEHGFEDIKSWDTFAERVPISSYEQLYPYIERVLKGEQNVLWPTEIKMFAKSSGTTNARSKYIPVSKEALEDCHYKGGKDMLSIFVNNYPDTVISEGKGLSVGGSLQANPFNPNTVCGDVSALLMKNLPLWVEYKRAPSLEIALMDKWEEKIESIAQAVANENITNMMGVPTWTVVLLERILEIRGKSNISEVWPNMEVFFHGAVAFDPYRELFKKMIPSPRMSYLEIYNASEGFFGIQDQKDVFEMLLMLDYGVYYEFIPLEEEDKENPKTIPLYQVEIGKVYAVVISTNAGLWRYKIGDTVRFTSLSPYRIKIAGRTKHFINAFGEEVIVENADAAILEACKQTGANIKNYTAGPVYLEERQQGGHEWIVEFVEEPDDMERFTDVLDAKLREINSDYDAKRSRDIALVRPVVHKAPQDLFLHWMKKRGKLGGQHKVPRLANSREYLDDILPILK